MKRNKKKLNNKGFSLVELIIVIAIMAILTGALAPQLIKYLDKSRRAADVQAGQTIATAVSAALADEAAYNAAVAGDMTVTALYTNTSADAFKKAVVEILGTTAPKPKYLSATNTTFCIKIETDKSFSIYAGSSAATTPTGETVSPNMLYPNVGSTYSK